MGNGMQTQVYVQPVPGMAGDFCDTNPRASVDAGPGGLIAGAAGVTAGRFAWTTSNPNDADGSPAVVNNFGAGAVTGFVARLQQALITTYLADAGNLIPGGFAMQLFSAGGFWVLNDGATQALPGQKAYANLATGKVRFAATGAPATAVVTASVAASTFSVTGSLADNVLTVTAVGSGVVRPGATISGTGIATGTRIVSQIAGTAGGIGTYYVDTPEQTAASTTVSGTYGTMTVTAVSSGTLVLGGTLTGTGTVAGVTISQFITGAGGTGTYAVTDNTVVASTAITEAVEIETKFVCRSSGLAGEVVKMTSHLQG